MSLKKAMQATKKRRYGYGGDVEGGASEGVAESGAGGVGPGGTSGNGGSLAENDSAQFGIDVSDPNTPSQDPAVADRALAAFDRSQPNQSLQDLASSYAGKAGLVGLGLQAAAAIDRAAAGRNTGSNYGVDAQGNAVNGLGTGVAGGNPSTGDGKGGNTAETPNGANPFGSTAPTQTTPADSGMRKYVWDPVLRQYTLTNVGAGSNPMGYTQGQVFKMAAGGIANAPAQPRFVQGGGTGLSDSVPVKMDDGGDGRLADGEFVIPADVVSGLGGGSSKAGAEMLYQMMERIRQQAHGSKQQIRPVDPNHALPI